AGLVTMLVVAVAAVAWWESRTTSPVRSQPASPLAALGAGSPIRLPLVAVALLALQITLGAIVVKLALPPWTVILHLGTAMLLLATSLVVATQASRTPGPTAALVLALTQVGGAAAMVLLALPRSLQVAHAAVGTGVWAALVLAARGEPAQQTS